MNVLETMKQALEALEVEHSAIYGTEKTTQAITNLRAAIEQMEKAEPVAFVTDSGYGAVLTSNHGLDDGTPLYAHPAPAAPDSLVVDAALVGENAILHSELRRCRAALDAAIAKYPLLAATEYVTSAEKNSIGNLRAELGTYKTHPQPLCRKERNDAKHK